LSLKQILANKHSKIDSILNEFQNAFEKLSVQAQNNIIKLFRNGNFDLAAIQDGLSDYDELIQEFVNKYADVIPFTKQIGVEIGSTFVLSQQAIENYDLIAQTSFERLLNTKANIALDMKKMAVESVLGGQRFRTIRQGMEEILQDTGRRIGTELYTGITNADSIIKKDFYDKVDVQLFQYMGPRDDRTRDECRATLNDPRNLTGWTRAEIEASQTPFIERGGWNCRHEWVPFTKEV